MGQTLPVPVAALRARARTFNQLVDDTTHPSVARTLAGAYGALNAAAGALSELLEIGNALADDARSSRKQSRAKAVIVSSRLLVVHREYPDLVEKAILLGSGQDVEVYKHFAKRSLTLAAGIGARLSGVEYIKTAGDILGALKEAAETGQVLKLRSEQVRSASQLLSWADAITILALAWCYSAEALIADLNGELQLSQDEIVDLVVKRAARGARSWKRPGRRR